MLKLGGKISALFKRSLMLPGCRLSQNDFLADSNVDFRQLAVTAESLGSYNLNVLYENTVRFEVAGKCGIEDTELQYLTGVYPEDLSALVTKWCIFCLVKIFGIKFNFCLRFFSCLIKGNSLNEWSF